jgi:hypothetical protein
MPRSTIEPTVPHIAIAATAAQSIRAEGLAGAVEPGFCSARTDEDLDEIAREQVTIAAVALVHAAHARELLEARRAGTVPQHPDAMTEPDRVAEARLHLQTIANAETDEGARVYLRGLEQLDTCSPAYLNGLRANVASIAARQPAPRKASMDLYRNADGHEVWRILDATGAVVHEDVASDHDAQWLLEQVTAADEARRVTAAATATVA